MYKSRLCVITIALASLLTSVAHGQVFSFKPQPSTTAPTPASLPPPLTPISPDDFTKQVGTMNQQTQKDLKQQVMQKLTKKPVTPIIPPPPTSSTSTATQQAPTTTAPAEKTKAPEDTSATSSDNEESQTEAPPAQSNGTAAPAQNQPYTGFQSGGTTGGSSNTGGSQSSGGWDIKY